MQAITSSVQGMRNNWRRFESHAQNVARWGARTEPGDQDISLPEEMVGMRLSQRGFEANATVFRAQDEMLGSFLDTFA